jgi:hypothetical protein
MNPIVQNTSANIARHRESLLPIPITLGKVFEMMLKLASFCRPWEMNIEPNAILQTSSKVESPMLW